MNQKTIAKKQGFVGVFGNEKVELNNELEIVSMISMNQKTTSEEWNKEFDEKFVAKFYDDYGKIIKEQFKFYNIKTNKFFELETIENEFCPPFLIKSFISTLIAQKQKEVLESCLPPIKKINGFEVGGYNISREDIIQNAKEKFNINL